MSNDPGGTTKSGEVLIDFNRPLLDFYGATITTGGLGTQPFTMGRACLQALAGAEGDDVEVHRCKALALKMLSGAEGEDQPEYAEIVLAQKSRDRIRSGLKIWPAGVRTAVLEILDGKSHEDILEELNE